MGVLDSLTAEPSTARRHCAQSHRRDSPAWARRARSPRPWRAPSHRSGCLQSHDCLVLFVHLVVTTVRLTRPGGARAIVAESLLLKQQLLIATHSRRRAQDLRPRDRVVMGLCAGLMRRARLHRCAIVLKPATILGFQRLLVKWKYRHLFSPKRRGRSGPKGPSSELIAAIVEVKRRNPRFGYQRIADQVKLAFDIAVDKHLVRRVLARHYRSDPGSGGPSWLTFLGHSRDSLWSVDLFRCESLILRTHWVMVVMDQYTRRIVGFAVCRGSPDGPSVCGMLRHINLRLQRQSG